MPDVILFLLKIDICILIVLQDLFSFRKRGKDYQESSHGEFNLKVSHQVKGDNQVIKGDNE